jgi:hypothetical protein
MLNGYGTQEPLGAAEVDAAIHLDSNRASFRNARPLAMVPRHRLLGTRVQFLGLQRTHNGDPCSHIYDLGLGATMDGGPATHDPLVALNL